MSPSSRGAPGTGINIASMEQSQPINQGPNRNVIGQNEILELNQMDMDENIRVAAHATAELQRIQSESLTDDEFDDSANQMNNYQIANQLLEEGGSVPSRSRQMQSSVPVPSSGGSGTSNSINVAGAQAGVNR